MTPYFGTREPLPPTRTLRAGRLTMLYERGNLRYIRFGNHEILRMIYAAVRDRNWLTAPYQLENETIDERPDGFRITYTAVYRLEDIHFRADLTLEGSPDGTISVAFEGRALSTFWRNRIGLCVHHPLRECIGKPVEVTQPDGIMYGGAFPARISPHQPFRNIQEMGWQPLDGLTVTLRFAGDVFETEDQRNWSDASYKTYSTPLERPFPVQLLAGDTVQQHLTLQTTFPDHVRATEPVASPPPGERQFPRLGFGRNAAQPLNRTALKALRRLRPDHYRVELELETDWRPRFRAALLEAQALETKLEIAAYFSENWRTEALDLLDVLSPVGSLLHSLLPLRHGEPVVPPLLHRFVYSETRALLPDLLIGYGTDGFFAELNRHRPSGVLFDFLAFSLNPQVHASDTRTLIENIQAQRDTVRTARTFSRGKPVHVTPVTLKPRYFPPQPPGEPPRNIDPRQTTELAAAFTLLSLAYLSEADQVTYYEATGPRGLMQEDGQTRYPVYEALRQLMDFRPVTVLHPEAENPLQTDGFAVENGQGKRLNVRIDWEKGSLHLSA
ncbi:hypothetical protein [Tellurirhabdus rosea]|uniref:hypothetical protein n=1 Tax=Tellurirhabdus rosea TaxID=2674997 RepID=UPI00224ED0F8|nr:hypothetical protein [Tellurirhabdus rosea]